MLLNNTLRYFSLAIFAGLFLLPYTADAQRRNRKKKGQPTPEQVLHDRLVQHINILAHDSLEGRRTGTEGERKAVRYLTTQYAQLSIAGAMNGSYLQPFDIDEGKNYKDQSKVSIDGKALEPGRDYFAFAWSGEGRVESDANVALNESGEAWWIDVDPILEKNKENPHFLLAGHLQQVAKEAAA
ncbi:MAG TPA: hypothetical protein VK907_02880, partial [Phnomibacter sp.]|nr:hypothetical protein [Phnomibacter sp.]